MRNNVIIRINTPEGTTTKLPLPNSLGTHKYLHKRYKMSSWIRKPIDIAPAVKISPREVLEEGGVHIWRMVYQGDMLLVWIRESL